MITDTVTVRNTLTGEVSTVPRGFLKIPAIIDPKIYVVEKDGAKPYVEKTYKPRPAKKFVEDHPETTEVGQTDSKDKE